MALQDLTLDFKNKKIINRFLKGKHLILQKVVLALQCWVGDWFLDGDYGIKYGVRLENESLLLADIQDVIKSVDGVVAVHDIETKITYDGERFTQKVLNINATIITEDNEQFILNGLTVIVGS